MVVPLSAEQFGERSPPAPISIHRPPPTIAIPARTRALGPTPLSVSLVPQVNTTTPSFAVIPPPPPVWKASHTLRGHSRSLSAVAFSPDGRMLATAGADKIVLLWAFALPAGTVTTSAHIAPAPALTTDPLSPSSGAPFMPAPAFVRSLKGHTAGLNDVAWAPDSRHLATVADDKTIRLWDAATGECRKILRGHTHHVFCVAYSPNGGLLVSGGWDETVRVWDAKRGFPVRTIPAHSESVTCVAFARDGTVIASGSHDGLIRMWDTASGRCLKTLVADEDNSPVTFVSFTPNASYLMTATLDSNIRLWDYKSREGTVVKSYTGHQNLKYCIPARFITTIPNRHFVASGSEDGKVWIWDLQTRECVAKLDAHGDVVIALAAHPTQALFVTASLERDPTAKVFIA